MQSYLKPRQRRKKLSESKPDAGVAVQYGCGLSCPDHWINYDSSPTLRAQRIPLIGKIITKSRVRFPDRVKYGDIVKGLPHARESVDYLYCSHVLEHLSLSEFRIALRNSRAILKNGGVFRLVMPDLSYLIDQYRSQRDQSSAGIDFIRGTLMGVESRPTSLWERLISGLGNAHHLWLWDEEGAREELHSAGFQDVRSCGFGDSGVPHFKLVEDEERFRNSLALECRRLS